MSIHVLLLHVLCTLWRSNWNFVQVRGDWRSQWPRRAQRKFSWSLSSIPGDNVGNIDSSMILLMRGPVSSSHARLGPTHHHRVSSSTNENKIYMNLFFPKYSNLRHLRSNNWRGIGSPRVGPEVVSGHEYHDWPNLVPILVTFWRFP